MSSAADLTQASWAAFSRLLDEALELPATERVGWLEGLGAEHEPLKPALRAVLARSAGVETAQWLATLPHTAGAAAIADESDLRAEALVGPYRLLRELGVGGMGAVWLAERADGTLKRQVALKLPRAMWSRGLAERMARERDILAALEHPHIARLYDAGTDAQGRPFLALEYVEGQPIDAYCRERSLNIKARLQLLLQVAQAVAFAHSRLVVHRDLKPSNILVTADGQVRLLDFGIAKLMEGERTAETQLTQLAGRALTLDYASPEQIRGEPIGTASDVYSLGVVAYELLAGARPYKLKRGSAAELEEAIASLDAPLASAAATDAQAKKALKGDLDAILNQALKKDPDQRYATVDALARDVERYLAGQRVTARPDSLAYRLTRFARRYRTPLAAAVITLAAFGLAIGVGATALVILALLLGLGAALWQARKAQQQAEIARTEARISAAVQDFLESIFTASSGDQAEPARARQRTAVELLDEGASRVDQALDKAPQARIRVLKTLAAVYEDMMLHDRAADLRGRAARVAGAVHGLGNSEHIGLLAAQAQALNAGGHNAQARTVLAEADRLLTAQREPDTDSRMAIDIAMADLYNYQEDERGLPYAERAMQMLRGEAPSPAWVDALTVLGGLRRTVGDFEGARRAFAEAVDVAATMPGNVASKLPTLYDLWGFTELESGQSERGIELLRKVVTMDEAAGGPDSPNVFIGKGRLASALLEEGLVNEAFDIAKGMRERLADLPALQMFSLSTRMKEAEALLTIGRCSEALQRLRQLPDIDGEAARFPMHALTTWLLTARALTDRGDYDQAALALDRAQRVVSERDLGSRVATLRLAEARAQLWLDRGRAEEARREAQPILTAEGLRGLQPMRRRILEARTALAEGQPRSAEAVVRAAIAEISAGGPAARGRRLHQPILQGLLGQALLAQERAQDAVPVLRSALRDLEPVRDLSMSPDVAALRGRLGLALLSTGDRAGAVRELEAARTIQSRNEKIGQHYTVVVDGLAELLADF